MTDSSWSYIIPAYRTPNNNDMAPLRCFKCGADMGDSRNNSSAEHKANSYFCHGYDHAGGEPHPYFEVHLLGY